ncbi:MAG: ATP-binding protein [bacterium]|nr:ATP-binding protein [bacterium]
MTKKAGNTNNKAFQKPLRFFEKSGTVNPETSYYVPLENVVNSDLQDIKTMVDRGRYLSIFSPRQSGKTTFLEKICSQLHADPAYIVLLLSFEDYEKLDQQEFYSEIESAVYNQLVNRLKEVDCEKTEAVEQLLTNHHLTNNISFRQLLEKLNQIIQHKKIVIFIDEFDGIPFAELEGFLNSIRKLYLQFKKVKQKALYSVGLVGIRNITKLIVGGVSPFNIADQVDLPSFSLQNIHDLYAQYTAETNQPFTHEAVKKVYGETGGQPWLVNRLGTILTVNIKPQTVEPIDERDVEKAIKILLEERNHHFDNLYEKAKLYKETFVEIVFDHVEYSAYDEDQSWLEQYGLIKNVEGHAVVSNNIYKAFHLKAFFKEAKIYGDVSPREYETSGNILDMERILLGFEQYITKIGVAAFYKKGKVYEKTGQFLLTAWLCRFVSGGNGELHYELCSGLGRMDMMLTYKGRKYIIETKVNRYSDITKITHAGIAQLAQKYLATESTHEGYLVIFDTKRTVGTGCEPQYHKSGDKKIISLVVPIGKI